MNKINLIFDYLYFITTADYPNAIKNKKLTDIIQQVFYNHGMYYAYDKAEEWRKLLLNSPQNIEVEDYGAGSHKNNSKQKSVKNIAKHATQRTNYSRLLFRLINHFKPKNVLELGTSLGVSTMYMAFADSRIKIHTIEGCQAIQQIAKSGFDKYHLKNINAHLGKFDELLPELLPKIQPLEMVYIDGNHAKEPTIDYFNLCLKYAGEKCIFVFDDIRWSKQMYEAWLEISINDNISVAIDTFFVGIVFVNNNLKNNALKLRFL